MKQEVCSRDEVKHVEKLMLTISLGFKKHSTSICTHVFKQTVDYYRRHGNHVLLVLSILTKRSIMSTLVAVL